MPFRPVRGPCPFVFCFAMEDAARGSSCRLIGIDNHDRMTAVSDTRAWEALIAHAKQPMAHLKQLMADERRCESMFVSHDGLLMDYSRQVRDRPLFLPYLIAPARAAAIIPRPPAPPGPARGAGSR